MNTKIEIEHNIHTKNGVEVDNTYSIRVSRKSMLRDDNYYLADSFLLRNKSELIELRDKLNEILK